MTLTEFERHRPKLAFSLSFFAGSLSVVSVIPSYENEVVFIATLQAHDGNECVAVCVSPSHIMALVEEDSPGQPTWWWLEDIALR